jgi:hypothetical protein
MNLEHAMNRFRRAALPRHQPLPRDTFLHLDRPPVLCLRAERGTLWVTVDGEPEDIALRAGQGRVFDGRAPITVGAVGGDAVLSAFALAPQPGRLHRGWQALALRGRQVADLAFRGGQAAALDGRGGQAAALGAR